MEIGTTMVCFELDKERMATQTDKAVLLELMDEDGNVTAKEWVPLSKIEFEDSRQNADKYEVIMPKWLFYKKEVLPLHIGITKEFIVTTYADKYELLAAAHKTTIQ